MKIVLAFDKFKGSATSLELAKAAADAIHAVHPDAETVIFPCADGGDGTLEALMPKGAELIEKEVAAPLLSLPKVKAKYALKGPHAVIELAAASGLALVPEEQRDVMQANTFGTGELMLDAIRRGAKRITLGIGGSATNDCGMGILAALGFRFYDADGQELPPNGKNLALVAEINKNAVPEQVLSAQIDVITDVKNPLCGPDGAAAVYGPQKGASPQEVAVLDAGCANFARFMADGVADAPGAGAAGGVGAGLLGFLNATLHPGAEAVLKFLHFEEALDGADLVLTGEGKMDATTAQGKLPAAVASLCQKHGVPVVALCGLLEGDAPNVFTAVHCINELPITDLATAMQKEVCLSRLAETVVKELSAPLALLRS